MPAENLHENPTSRKIPVTEVGGDANASGRPEGHSTPEQQSLSEARAEALSRLDGIEAQIADLANQAEALRAFLGQSSPEVQPENQGHHVNITQETSKAQNIKVEHTPRKDRAEQLWGSKDKIDPADVPEGELTYEQYLALRPTAPEDTAYRVSNSHTGGSLYFDSNTGRFAKHGEEIYDQQLSSGLAATNEYYDNFHKSVAYEQALGEDGARAAREAAMNGIVVDKDLDANSTPLRSEEDKEDDLIRRAEAIGAGETKNRLLKMIGRRRAGRAMASTAAFAVSSDGEATDKRINVTVGPSAKVSSGVDTSPDSSSTSSPEPGKASGKPAASNSGENKATGDKGGSPDASSEPKAKTEKLIFDNMPDPDPEADKARAFWEAEAAKAEAAAAKAKEERERAERDQEIAAEKESIAQRAKVWFGKERKKLQEFGGKAYFSDRWDRAKSGVDSAIGKTANILSFRIKEGMDDAEKERIIKQNRRAVVIGTGVLVAAGVAFLGLRETIFDQETMSAAPDITGGDSTPEKNAGISENVRDRLRAADNIQAMYESETGSSEVPVNPGVDSPELPDIPVENFAIPDGGGGEALFNRLNIPTDRWYQNADTLLNSFPNDFYRMDGGGVGITRPGMLSTEAQEFIKSLR